MRILLYTLLLLCCGCVSNLQQGMDAFNSGNYDRSAYLLNDLAKQGNPDAQYVLGLLWYHGYGRTKKNYIQAHSWWRKAAIQNHAMALNNLGVMIENRNVVGNMEDAIIYYRRSARLGNMTAGKNLSRLGQTIPDEMYIAQQKIQAEIDRSQAANALLEAALSLGSAYYQGKSEAIQQMGY